MSKQKFADAFETLLDNAPRTSSKDYVEILEVLNRALALLYTELDVKNGLPVSVALSDIYIGPRKAFLESLPTFFVTFGSLSNEQHKETLKKFSKATVALLAGKNAYLLQEYMDSDEQTGEECENLSHYQTYAISAIASMLARFMYLGVLVQSTMETDDSDDIRAKISKLTCEIMQTATSVIPAKKSCN